MKYTFYRAGAAVRVVAALSVIILLTMLARAQEAASPLPQTAPAWKIPVPQETTHPGAASAPASSPLTYPQMEAFTLRGQLILDGLAQNDLGFWRGASFRGSDPVRYLNSAAIARLLGNPDDPMARQYRNDAVSISEQGPFAAAAWARFYPLFGDAVLTDATKTAFAEQAATRSDYLGAAGTELERLLWVSSAAVLPNVLQNGGRLSGQDKEAALAAAKLQLKAFVKNLYAAGPGAWESPDRLMTAINGLLNVYDFSPDPEARLLAKAGLDLLVAGYALQYRDGIMAGPLLSGQAEGSVENPADQTGWLWWGSNKTVTTQESLRFFETIGPITSAYRPNRILTNIATKFLPTLPVEEQITLFGSQSANTPKQKYRETQYVGRYYTLGSLWNGFGGTVSRLQLVASSTTNGAIEFTGGHPRRFAASGEKIADGITYGEGGGGYDQSAQAGGAYICLSRIPRSEPLAYVFFSRSDKATRPVKQGSWWVMQAGNTFIGLRGLGESVTLGETDLTEKEQAEYKETQAAGLFSVNAPKPIFRFEGRRTGFILQVGDRTLFGDLEEFATALNSQTVVDLSKWDSDMEVRYISLEKNVIRVRYVDSINKAAQAEVFVDSRRVVADNWSLYGGQYVDLRNSVLSVNDGRDGYRIDFRGDLPVYQTIYVASPYLTVPAPDEVIPTPTPPVNAAP